MAANTNQINTCVRVSFSHLQSSKNALVLDKGLISPPNYNNESEWANLCKNRFRSVPLASKVKKFSVLESPSVKQLSMIMAPVSVPKSLNDKNFWFKEKSMITDRDGIGCKRKQRTFKRTASFSQIKTLNKKKGRNDKKGGKRTKSALRARVFETNCSFKFKQCG